MDCYLSTEVASAESIFTNDGGDDGDAVLRSNNISGFYILDSYTVVKKYRMDKIMGTLRK